MLSAIAIRTVVAVAAGMASLVFSPTLSLAQSAPLSVVEIAQAPSASAGDYPASKDPAFLKRYEGSKIVAYMTRPFDEYTLLVEKDLKPKKVEGAITRIIYRVPTGHTALELLRNYEQAVKEAGLEIKGELLPCNKEYERLAIERMFADQLPLQLGTNPYTNGSSTNPAPDGPMCYFSAQGTRDGQDISIAVMVVEKHANFGFKPAATPPVALKEGEILVGVDVVAAKAVENKMVEVKASDLADALATAGKIDLYGIFFDTDKTDVKPESTKTLDEIATLLKIDRGLKLEVAGHTDNTGDKAHNQTLSEGRAKAVVDVLVKKYGIDAARLQAKGYGDTVPVSDNTTDSGRAKNRRVELKKI